MKISDAKQLRSCERFNIGSMYGCTPPDGTPSDSTEIGKADFFELFQPKAECGRARRHFDSSQKYCGLKSNRLEEMLHFG